MIRLLGTTLSILLAVPALPADAQVVVSSLPWTWPWSRRQERLTTTLIHPASHVIIRRDHSVAETQARSQWQQERVALERQHRANLQSYVETRLALAEENARLHFMREEQLARATGGQGSDVVPYASGTASSLAASAAGAWTGASGRPPDPSQPSPGAAKRMIEQVHHIARELPRRTQQVLAGNDELVGATMANGMSKGLSVFIALLMLHIPSVALVSLVTGVFLVRGHRQRSGILFLGLAAVLGVLIFFVIPW